MKHIILIFLTAIIAQAAPKLDTTLSSNQVERFVTYYTMKELRDSIHIKRGASKQKVLQGRYGDQVTKIFKDRYLESYASFFMYYYTAVHFKTKNDCKNRWQAVQWFIDTGRDIGISDNELKEKEGDIVDFTLKICKELMLQD